MNLDRIHSVYFLGIGGIGMSALARWFHANGFAVSGYDKTSTALTLAMMSEGIEITYDDDLNGVPEKITQGKEGTIVVYTPAIPTKLELYNFFLAKDYTVLKRSKVLGLLTESKFTIAVAGTHGKTTTSSIVTHILHANGIDCSAFVGGIMTNYNSNLVIGSDHGVMVVEADEYDRSFLTLHPDIAIITATDADHLDIYGSKDSLKESFLDFIGNIKKNGRLFVEERVASELDLSAFSHLTIETYGLDSEEWHVDNLRVSDAKFCFDVIDENGIGIVEDIRLGLPGYHNVSNALAAVLATSDFITDGAQYTSALNSYLGVKRRFETILSTEEIVFIDDYAHHPKEIDALIESVRALYPEKEITAVFQPHLFTRTRDFMHGFAESLSGVDKVLLLDIYPARELPIEGITSDVIAKAIVSTPVERYVREDVVDYFQDNRPDVLLTIGAGDIDTLVEPIKQKLMS